MNGAVRQESARQTLKARLPSKAAAAAGQKVFLAIARDDVHVVPRAKTRGAQAGRPETMRAARPA
jgi:hypothetical protein